MAKDKKSFLLYSDLIYTVSKLPDDKAGALFKHILSYVNDENPETDDIIINIAFEPIKQALKRDLKRYEEIRERNRENARKRWDTNKSDDVQKDATACDRMPNDAKHADNVNDSDNVNDNVIIEKKEKPLKSPKRGKAPKKRDLSFPFSSEEFMKSWNLLVEMPKWKKKIDHSLQLALNKLGKYEEKFAIELMERAIAGNYQGVVFSNTDEDYSKWILNKTKLANNGNTQSLNSKSGQTVSKNKLSRTEQATVNLAARLEEEERKFIAGKT